MRHNSGQASESQKPPLGLSEVFQELDDDLGLARAWLLMAEPLFGKCRYDEAAGHFRRALVHAERTGDEREMLLVHDYLHQALYFGSAHVSVVRAEAEAMMFRAEGHPRARVFALLTLASVTAMGGDAQESRQLYLRAKSIAEEMGLGMILGVAPFFSQEVGLLFGDAEFTEREVRAGYERLEAVGDKSYRSTMAAVLAEALYQLGRHEEAEQFVDIAIALGSADDVATQAQARAVQAKLLAATGDFGGAERVAREAVEHSQDADDIDMRSYVLLSAAETLRLAGRDDEAAAAFQEAADLSERKGNVVRAKDARARLAELDVGSV